MVALTTRPTKRATRRRSTLVHRMARTPRRSTPPRLVVIGGLIGTGKSTLARQLAKALGAVWLRTDEIRLREFGHLPRPRRRFAEGRYAPHISALVYQRLIRRATTLIKRGRSVVCDGTFSKHEGREALRRAAARYGASFYFFECVVPRAVALRRVAARYAAGTDFSEAQPEHYDRLRVAFEPIQGWPSSCWRRLSTSRAPETTAQVALKLLRPRHRARAASRGPVGCA